MRPRGLGTRAGLDRVAAAIADVDGLVAELACDLVDRCRQLNAKISDLERRLGPLVGQLAANLLAVSGCGLLSAGKLIGETGRASRFRFLDAYARFNGTAPVPAHSGNSEKMRLNRGGNRQVNTALHMIAVTQLRRGGPGADSVAKRQAAGDDKTEAVRARTLTGPPTSRSRPARWPATRGRGWRSMGMRPTAAATTSNGSRGLAPTPRSSPRSATAPAGRFCKDDFDIDLAAATVTCPAGATAPINLRGDGSGTTTFGGISAWCLFASVSAEGLEPSRTEVHTALNRARLPIPPRRPGRRRVSMPIGKRGLQRPSRVAGLAALSPSRR